MFFHQPHVWFKTVEDIHSKEDFFQNSHLVWLPICSNMISSAWWNFGVFSFWNQLFLNLWNLRLFSVPSSQIILHTQQFGQEWLVTMSNNLTHLQRMTICHPWQCTKAYATGSRHNVLRETAEIYCSTSASLVNVITCCQHRTEVHNWIYKI